MGKIVRLTESDLIRLVNRVINEQSAMGKYPTINEEMTSGGTAMAGVSYDTLWDFLEKNGYNCRNHKRWDLPEGYEITCTKRFVANPIMRKPKRYSDIDIWISKKLKESKIKLGIYYRPTIQPDIKIIESLKSILGPSKFKEGQVDEEFKYYSVSDYFNLNDVNKVKTLVNSKIKSFEELISKRGYSNEAEGYFGPESDGPTPFT